MTRPLVALTSYYNPFHGERRRRNYHVFRRHLGVPLVTVEWAIDDRFELADTDADLVIRVAGGDLLWQKERLINIGLARIRAGSMARDVVVIDADVVFADRDWPARVGAALDQVPMVQCFSRVDYLPPLPQDAQSVEQLAAVEPERWLPSLSYAMSQGRRFFTADAELGRVLATTVIPVSGNPGLCSALRLPSLPQFEYYEANIVGGGDQVLMAAAIGELDVLYAHRTLSQAHQADQRAWAQRCVPVQPRWGFADNRVLHLWHGPMEGRRYGQRASILAARDYDPARDLDRSATALRFAKGAGELKAAVQAYMSSRGDA